MLKSQGSYIHRAHTPYKMSHFVLKPPPSFKQTRLYLWFGVEVGQGDGCQISNHVWPLELSFVLTANSSKADCEAYLHEMVDLTEGIEFKVVGRVKLVRAGPV
jgi:hypothetical protein